MLLRYQAILMIAPALIWGQTPITAYPSAHVTLPAADDISDHEFYAHLEHSRNRIKEYHPNGVRNKQLRDAAVAGMLRSLDRHGELLTPEKMALLAAASQSACAGVGIAISKRDGSPAVVQRVLPASAAK